ncbi:hypothetical protein CI102_1054 [Trichoderma harzianum]|uniref:Uncharacterized protein n=1 Tax=Trichoderma harzianum CBS 226.95 TaxID=983964 RepID=A0A2T4AT74_TRIHA|nr:hypothetical protein M431DRAFT_175598 [Trichoderma harzianum CBS 226.95]PKK54299.1 hypothetical protein CI102_1054 [Trichoderma harzianum]PTB60251.1 hypothetical protein M431DRAFT_175598 [Trichoderma harzianum CBS 226.95]
MDRTLLLLVRRGPLSMGMRGDKPIAPPFRLALSRLFLSPKDAPPWFFAPTHYQSYHHRPSSQSTACFFHHLGVVLLMQLTSFDRCFVTQGLSHAVSLLRR